ncbi:NADH:flavin oxidoreductase/NADH oxidase [Actinomyces polynesiensis]|uniref:NADH:flavin oxidoreductase/NADH oxidase n=1 Tax=Actinomyces polynesiensis TaxID=1325934 RepID=UPI0005B8B1BF|nr:NADH:flavin oxidoreductase/NADH oxidase [Actinomyces polynesiensis]
MPHAKLFEPVPVAHLEVPNRLWMPPMCQYSAEATGPRMGMPTDWHRVHYGASALGGVGAVIIEATAVAPEGRISVNCLSFHEDDRIPAFAELARLIHAGGAAAFVQLNHAGRKGSARAGWLQGHAGPDEGGWPVVGASPVPFATGWPVPRELSDAEVEGVVEDFAHAARRAVEAGFDGVQVHAAHGYLIHQFLSPASNHRTDRWGGDFAGRTRLAREVVRAIRDAIGDAALLVRVSATDWTQEYPEDGRPGWTLEDTRALAPLLVEDGADMVNVSTGGNVPDARIGSGPGYQVFAAAAVREAVGTGGGRCVPVAACGLVLAPEQAEQILVDGRADVVEIGRVMLTDPMAPRVWRRRLRVDPGWPPQLERGTAR